MKWQEMLSVLASRGAPPPLTWTQGIRATSPSCSRSRSRRMRALVLGMRGPGQFDGPGQPDDVRHVLGPRPPAFLLVAADHHRPPRRAAADEEHAHPLRRVELVPGERQQIDVAELAGQVDRQLADRLRGVGVEDDRRIGFLGDSRELLDGEDHARLVVGVHDRHQGRVGVAGRG